MMKARWSRRLLVFLLAVLGLGMLGWLTRSRATGFATPQSCIEAYYDAWVKEDQIRYLDCLGEPLRSAVQVKHASPMDWAEGIHAPRAGIRSLGIRLDDGEAGTGIVQAEADEVTPNATRRVRFRLRQVGRAWRIVGIDAAGEAPSPIPFGTHISKPPAGGDR